MKTKTLYVTALISTLLAIVPVLSQATCETHQSQQAGNETAVGGKKVAGGEGTGASQKLQQNTGLLAGGEGTGAEQKLQFNGTLTAGGEGTGAEGRVLVDSSTSLSNNSQ